MRFKPIAPYRLVEYPPPPLCELQYIRNYLANTTHSTDFKHKNTIRDLCLGRGRIGLFSSVRYSILRGAVWSGTVHSCSHTGFIDRFMMPEVGDPLILPFTSK